MVSSILIRYNDGEKFDEILSVYENSDILGFRFNK